MNKSFEYKFKKKAQPIRTSGKSWTNQSPCVSLDATKCENLVVFHWFKRNRIGWNYIIKDNSKYISEFSIRTVLQCTQDEEETEITSKRFYGAWIA